MNKKHLFIYLLFYPFFCFSQQLSFEPSEVLFNHPNPSSTPSPTGVRCPFIPFDYNSDGLIDFIGTKQSDNIYIYKGIGSNQFDQDIIQTSAISNPLKVMDFDNDGDMDVITHNKIVLYESADDFTIFYPNLNNTGETIVEVADFDNNGLYDLLTYRSINFDSGELTIYYNQVGGGFISEVVYLDNDGWHGDIEVADIDGNGDLDILVLVGKDNSFPVILYNSSTIFTPAFPPLASAINIQTRQIKLTDLDGDSDLDMIILGYPSGEVYIVENVDNFQTTNSIKLIFDIGEYSLNYFSVADLDLDGDTDIVVAGNSTVPFSGIYNNYTLYTIENKGGLNFDPAVVVEMFGGSTLVAVGLYNYNYLSNNLSLYDFDGDGKKDIIYVDGFGSDQIVYLKNTSTITAINKLIDKYDSSISVFPNPVNDQLKIEVENINDFSSYEIFTISGKKMEGGKLDGEFINVSSLQPGVYFLSLDQLNSIRFIKQ